MKKEIFYEIGFEDSELISYCRDENNLVIKIKAWNETLLAITFYDTAGMVDYGIGDVSNFVEELSSSPFSERVLAELYELIPDQHSYHLYQFLNLDGVPAFEVFATSVKISVL